MRVAFVAGFGPITRDPETSLRFWQESLGIAMEEIAPSYYGTDDLEGVNAFASWPLRQAAESCFGTDAWPPDVPEPHAWLELDVEDEEAVSEAAADLKAAGHRLVREPGKEPWGQTVARLLSPEGLLVGITYTPWMHEAEEEPEEPMEPVEPEEAEEPAGS